MEGMEGTAIDARQPGQERFPYTKFVPPVLDERVVTDHLVAQLEAAISSRPLTLVIAPAGSGKTTALAAWVDAAPGDVLWVRLDPDDEPSVLASALLEGGRHHLGSGFGARLGGLLSLVGTTPTCRQLVTSLVNDLGELDALTLVLDDAHTVSGPATSAFLDDLLDHLPPGTRAVIGSRTEPDVSLARRRIRGDVAELGLDGLRLDRGAVQRVLAHDASVTDEEVDAVLAASGGWAAGVRMATARLGTDPPRTTTPPPTIRQVEPDLRRFLAEEVLQELPERLRTFLLETSILDELRPADCDAVTGFDDSAEILAELDRRNLFVTRHLGVTGESWRTHDLFRAFLREQLTRSYTPTEIERLHRRAAAALPTIAALPHLLAAGDHQTVAERIVQLVFADLETTTVFRLMPVVRALPDALLEADHRLALVSIWPEHVRGEAHEVIRTLEPLWGRLIADGRDRDAAEVSVILAEAYLQVGDQTQVGDKIEHALAHIDEAWRAFVLADAMWWNYYRNDWVAASRCLQEAIEVALAAGEPGPPKAVGPALSPFLLFADPGPPWVADAAERLARGLGEDDRATRTGMRPVCAGAALLRLDIDTAVSELRECLRESRAFGMMAWKHQEAEVLLMSICLGSGDLATAHRTLDDALPRLDEPVYRQYRHVYAYLAMRAHWLADDHRQVTATYDRYLAGQPRSDHLETVVVHAVAGAMVAQIDGRTDEALTMLQDVEDAQRAGRCWLVAGLPGLDRGSILLADGRTAAAIEAALPTLDEAARVGPGLLFPESRANRALLERCLRAGVHAELLRAVLAASRPSDEARAAVAIPGTDEVLSARELQVLTHVSSGASNRVIAGTLFISEATVKSHLTRILRKLEASSRTHAVARARELRLL